MKVKYRNYEAVFIHFDGTKTSFGCDFGNEALEKFKSIKTAQKMLLYISTHNNTRLKLCEEYGLAFK